MIVAMSMDNTKDKGGPEGVDGLCHSFDVLSQILSDHTLSACVSRGVDTIFKNLRTHAPDVRSQQHAARYMQLLKHAAKKPFVRTHVARVRKLHGL